MRNENAQIEILKNRNDVLYSRVPIPRWANRENSLCSKKTVLIHSYEALHAHSQTQGRPSYSNGIVTTYHDNDNGGYLNP